MDDKKKNPYTHFVIEFEHDKNMHRKKNYNVWSAKRNEFFQIDFELHRKLYLQIYLYPWHVKMDISSPWWTCWPFFPNKYLKKTIFTWFNSHEQEKNSYNYQAFRLFV